MSQEKINLFKIFQWSQSNELIKKLLAWGALNEQPVCNISHCGRLMTLSVDQARIDGYIWICANQSHAKGQKRPNSRANVNKFRQRVSIRHGSFFMNSHLELRQIVGFVRMWVTSTELQVIEQEMDISHATAVIWNAYCYEISTAYCTRQSEQIGGDGKIVEIDESKFGKRKYHRGHHVEGQWVFGGVERGTGKCFLVPVDKRDRATLIPLIQKYIKPGTTIMSDCWRAYDVLSELDFAHLKVNRSINFVDPTTGAHTNTVESLWRHVKNRIPTYNRRNHYFADYLSKYMFLKRCKHDGLDETSEFLRYPKILYRENHLEDIDG